MKAIKKVMEQREDGYKAARKIDKEISDLLDAYSIEEHPWMWLTLARTVRTTLTLIEEIAKKAIEDA